MHAFQLQSTEGRTPKWARAALLVAGIICIGVWGNLLGYSHVLFPAMDSGESACLGASYTAGRLAVALLFIALASTWQRHAGAVGFACGVALMPATLLTCLGASLENAPVASFLLAPSTILQANGFLAGIGFLAISVPLFIKLAQLEEPRHAAALAMAGIVGECVASSALNAVESFDVQLGACLLAPLFAGTCLFAACKTSHDETKNAPDAPGPRRKAPTGVLASLALRDNLGSALLVAQLAVAMVLASSLRYLSNMGPWGLQHEGYMGAGSHLDATVFIACAVVVAATLATFVAPKKLASQMRCALALVVAFAGLTLATAQPDANASRIVAAAVMGCQLFCRVIIWVTFMACVRQLRMQPLRVNGITCLFNVAGTMAFSWALGQGADPSFLSMGLMEALLAVAIIAAALPFIGRNHMGGAAPAADEQQGGEATEHDKPNPNPATAKQQELSPLHEFAAAHKISPREEQVLGLLLDGCTRGQIERLLGLSEGTVRTHVNAVYRKLDVHSKAQAHDLYDAWVGEGADVPSPETK